MVELSYFMSLPGVLKPAILVLDFILIICCAVVVNCNQAEGMWFSWIVIITCLLVVLAMMGMIALGVWDRLPVNKAFLEFIVSAIYVIGFFVVFITVLVAAIKGDITKDCNGGNRGSAYGAATVFSLLMLAVWSLNTWGHFTMWKSGSDGATIQQPGV